MSWAEEDWTVGLSGRVLQKVKELQVHQERLSRENKQKQLQLDNIHTSLEKQTVKYEEVRGELQSVQRELQRVQDEAKAAVTSGERLTQELQTKQAQVCSFEGQLDAARTLNNKLTQEVKRLEAELEKLQNSGRSADTTLFSTPCWNTTSPWEHNGSRKEERSAHQDEGQSRSLNIRQRLQFSEVATASLPRQQHRNTPSRNPSDQSDSFSTPLGAFPWERDDSRPAARRRSPPSPKMPCAEVVGQGQSEQGICGKETDYRAETDTLRSRLSALEGELCSKATMLKSIQNELTQSKKELAARELIVQKSRDELSLAHTRIARESERASGAEQRVKQLQEELKCQRQNAESSRLQHQQRSKELEKQHQRDLTELQRERQCLEKQHQQEVNKLNQEIQQARTLHNALQAQADKLSLQKQALEKELDTLKEKLKWTEGQLQESQKKEAQTQAKLTEAVREAEGVAVSLEQSRKKERALEEEGRRLAEERADALRLLKELQEQKDAPAPLLQPVQFCPVGQGFSPQPSYSLNSRQSPHIRRSTTATLAEQKREEEVDTECLQREGHRKRSEEENKRENEAIESDSSGRNKHSTFDHALSTLSHSAAGRPTNNSMDGDRCDLMRSAEETPHKSEQAKASEDLKRENAGLRSELHDVREELQKRLEDLEAQRRAEAEARTRLKQLSRKHASQSVEKNEQDKQWRAQLESEKAETERLRKTIAALETEMKQGKEKREKNEREEAEEKNKALEDRESEMIELNIQLKKQLADLKAQLALEREERKREEEERNQITNTDMDVKKELSMKLEELKTELEELKRSRTEDSLEDEKLSAASSPLTYLTLHDDELNSNMVHCDESFLSPEQHLIFCQSTNQHNVLVSQATTDLIQEERTVINPEVASDLEDTRQNNRTISSGALKDESRSSDLMKEVKHLQTEKAKETERANQYQVKLEALQSQVTRQTQQLTMAFEKQSQHISGLLAELQEKERSLLSQGEELQRYKQEVDALKAQKQEEEMMVKETEDGEQIEGARDESSTEISGLQPNHEKEGAVSSLTTNSQAGGVSIAQRDAGQQSAEIITSERPPTITDNEALWSGEQHPDKTESNHDFTCVMGETECSQDEGTADVVLELLALRQENQLLKQRISSLTVSDTSTPVLHSDAENQEDPANQSQNTGNASLPCPVEQRSSGVLNDISNGVQQSALQSGKRIEDEGGDLEREEGKTAGTEEVLEAVCPLQIQRLQQQVVELNMKVRALSEETQQQTEELAVWRLASQPAPTFDLTNTDNESETQDKISAIRQSNQQQTDAMMQAQVQAPHLDVEESHGNITLIREDELLLSCSSSKLQGRMLFSRLQHRNHPGPKSFQPSKKTTSPQEYICDTAEIDKDSEKENQEITLSRQSNICQTQQKQKTESEVVQMSSEKTGQQQVTKDSHKVSGPKQTKTAECHMGNPDASRLTNEIKNNIDYSKGDVRTEMKSTSSQTEESLYPRSSLPAPELHCAYTQTEEEEEEEEDDEDESVESPPVSPVPLREEPVSADKILFSGSFPIPADPARLAERIRRNRTQLSAAFDDTEYEPYGLPEVVMKGFADIPSGPSCPYIVRRGLLGTSVVPVPQKKQKEEETD
ncbi:centromere protein F isoform X2 [Acanthopagrus latus]|uniref:centromere protein F isoform X2 n=1 Tax=Acanthopagrus latus TaxID=8177 RepID=UPI00187BE2DE|nr:centromere protein F isoform X2 [Acanthopagrus latus]